MFDSEKIGTHPPAFSVADLHSAQSFIFIPQLKIKMVMINVSVITDFSNCPLLCMLN